MLLTLTRKICPLLSLAIATVGCGKKISEPKALPASSTENQELPSTYIIQLDGSEASSKTYTLPRNTLFQIPERLKVRAGATLNKVVDIIYDVDPYDSDVYDFKCSYVTSSNPAEMKLTYCQNDNGNDFYDITTFFPLKEGQSIVMKFTGASSPDLIVEAIYSMKWK